MVKRLPKVVFFLYSSPMKEKSLLEKNYLVSSYLVNFQGKLGLYHLLNLLQDIASEHAQSLGFGLEEMIKNKTFWVLTRQKLVMDSWPKLGEEISIHTWLRLESGPFSNRDFAIYQNNKKIGECSTSWVALNSETRRMVNIDRSGIFAELKEIEKVSVSPGKIAALKEAETLAKFSVRNSDIDQNMHVNNTKYAQWVLDAISFDWHKELTLMSYEVNFIAETKLNDTVAIQKGERQSQTDGSFLTTFQGIREADNKIVFTSQFGVKENSGR